MVSSVDNATKENVALLSSIASEDDGHLLIPPIEKPKITALMVILRVFIPIILLWDLFKVIMRAALGKKVGHMVLESYDYTEAQSAKDYMDQIEKFAKSDLADIVKHKREFIETFDGAEIDTITFSFDEKRFGKKHSGVYIIHCPANAENYESKMMNFANWANDIRGTVVSFNYRGVGSSKSEATSFNDLDNDAIAVTQNLIDEGVDPENIYLHGFSLGGIVASDVNGQLRSVNTIDESMYVYPDRAPSSLTKTAIGFVRRGGQVDKRRLFNRNDNYQVVQDLDGYTESPFWKFIATLLYPIAKLVLHTTQWDADLKGIFKTPIDHRETITVKSPVIYRAEQQPQDDNIISDYASLSKLLKKERQEIKNGDLAQFYGQDLDPEELEKIRDAHAILRKARKFTADYYGHWIDIENLQSKAFGDDDRHVTAYQHFLTFIKATHGNGFKKQELTDSEKLLYDAWKTAGY